MLSKLKIHHIGIATDDITLTKHFYEQLGYVASAPIADPIQRVLICLLTHPNHVPIELVQPLTEKSSVNKILSKNGVTPYHICYEVEDIDSVFDLLTEHENFIPLFRPVEATAMGDKLICYLYRKDVGYIEIIEK